MADFETIRDAKNELVLADLHLAVLFAPSSTAALSTLEDPSTGDVVALTGYRSAGLMEKSAGVSITNDTENTDIEAYGDAEPVRTIINKKTVSFQATFLETNITTLEKFWGKSFSNIIPTSHGGVVLEAPSLPKNVYYRCILFGQDDVDDAPLYTYWLMPRVKLDSVDNQDLKDDGAVTYTLTFKAFRDSVAGFSVAQGWCGPGWTHLVSRAGFVAAPTGSLVVTAVSGDLSVTAAAGADHTVQLKAVGNNGINYTPLVSSWVSADPTKCTVSSSGLVTGVSAAASTAITATYLPAGASSPITGTVNIAVT
jgi:hypothetical protein